MPLDLVVFRRWKETGDVIALFPELPADNLGRYCISYEHIGQHGAADYCLVIRQTLPATPDESAALAAQLTHIGYRLRPVQRASFSHHQRRLADARAVAPADTR